jgi:hypothetical protein
MPANRYHGPSMTLGNMRANGVRSLSVNCWLCRRGAVLAVDRWPQSGLSLSTAGPMTYRCHPSARA